jgi:pilus assembly protein CpaC
MKTLSAVFAFLVLLLSTTSAFAHAEEEDEEPTLAPPQEIALALGRVYLWKAPKGSTVSVSNGSVVHVMDLGSALKITGKKNGEATLSAAGHSLHVVVLPESSFRVYEELNHGLQGRRGLELGAEGKDVVVRGRLLRMSDWRHLAGHGEDDYRFTAHLDDALKSEAKSYFRSLLSEHGLPDLDLEFDSGAHATVPSDPKDLEARVEKVLGPYGFTIDSMPSALALEPLVRVKIVVAEIKKNMANSLGIEWPDHIEAQLIPRLSDPIKELTLKVHANEQQDWGQVLASPTLLCRSGKDATFLAGGEFPIKIINFKTQDVVWKKYGVLLQIHPQADFKGRMSIGIETEVSKLNQLAVDSIPALDINRIETHFDLSSPRTIVLSGLIHKDWNHSSTGIPGLGSLPILGPLFSSRDYNEGKSELIILVRPEVVDPTKEGV